MNNLYHLTAIPPTAVTALIHGSFTGPRHQELLLATSTTLELYRLHPKLRRLLPLFRTNCFASIRALSALRLPATRRDYILLTCDTGSLVVLSPDLPTATFRTVHCEPFGRSGARRLVPGQFLVCEPRGRAAFVAAVERSKFAYVLNRDAQSNLTISSPLDAHKSATAVFAVQALDVGFENPMFVALERPYQPDALKSLVYYELDLGLNHVVRKLSVPVKPSSYVLVPVPGHTDGPGGILVCSAGYVTYRNFHHDDQFLASNPPPSSAVQHLLEAPLPFRRGSSQTNTMIVCATAYHDRKGNAFFFMLCTEFGDLIKAELTWTPEHGPQQLRLVYFDTLPAPAVALTIFRSGFLFAALEGSDSLLLKFRAVDVPDDDPAGGLSIANMPTHPPENTHSSPSLPATTTPPPAHLHDSTNGNVDVSMVSVNHPNNSSDSGRLHFSHKPRLSYLSLVSSIDSLGPILSMCNAVDVDGETALMLTSGRGKSGSLRSLRRGIGVIEMSQPHPLASRISNVFTFKDRVDGAFHRYIVVSFRDRTKVLLVGEGRVEETASSGFELSASTIAAGQMSEDSLLQVHALGVRFIPGGRAAEAKEWKPPVPSRIVGACCNNGQAVIALSSGVVVYFEIDGQKEDLLEMQKINGALVPSGGDAYVSHGAGDDGVNPALAISEVPPGRRRASFFAVGDGANSKVRVYRVKNDGTTEALGIHLAPAPVESVALIDFGIVIKDSSMGAGDANKSGVMDESSPYSPLLSLVIGTKHGAVVRIAVDDVTGSLGDKRSIFIGPDRVRVRCASMGGVPTCFVLGSRPHLMFAQGGRIMSSPLGTDGVQHAAAFSSEESPDGFVAAHGSKLRLLCVDLLHALQAGSELPTPAPVSALPAPTATGCMFQLTRSRGAGTVRRVVRVVERALSDGGRREQGSGKRPRAHNMFVAIECEHRAAAGVGENVSSRVGLGSRRVEVRHESAGKWYSRLVLVKMGASEGTENEDGEVGEFDGSDGGYSFGSESVSYLDSIVTQESSECFLSAVSTCGFPVGEGDADTVSYVVVSHARNMVASATGPEAGKERRSGEEKGNVSGMLSVYRIDKGLKLRRVHETAVDEPGFVMCEFRDMIAVGVGNSVRLYGLGKKQLLRKLEYRLAVRNAVCAMVSIGGDRMFVADRRESVTLFKYVRAGADGQTGRLVAIASDELTRWVTCLHALDYSTVCGGDKFGNVFILRLPVEVAAAAEETGWGGGEVSGARGGKSGAECAPHALRVEACVHIGSVVTAITSARIKGVSNDEVGGGGEECVVYATMDGAVGVVAPVGTDADAEFARRLEMAMRVGWRSVVGRDHLSFRSAFYAARGVVDGDLCELFVGAPQKQKEQWAVAVGRSVADVLRKLEELRASAI